MSEFNYKKYLKEGRLLKEEKSASDFKYGDRIIYNFNGEQIPGKILDHFGDGIFIGLDRSISFEDPESVGRANPMGYNTDLSVDMFELFDGEENPYGSIDNVELAESKSLKENKINNSYLVKSEEHSNDFEDYYEIDEMKALKYLSQFDDDFIDAKNFIDDDEGWGEFIMYLEDKEQMTDKELEDAMKMEMSYYYFSDGDSI